jgi:hypothetical protein
VCVWMVFTLEDRIQSMNYRPFGEQQIWVF